MAEIYVGNLDPNITSHDIFTNFQRFGEIRKIKLPRTFKPRGYAFVEFKNHDDALFAIQSWTGEFDWHVELSRKADMLFRAAGVGSSSSSFRQRSLTNNCYKCGGYGHFARNCTFGYRKDMMNKGVKQSQRGRMKKNQIASTSIWKPISPPTPPWLELPEHITMTILQKLGTFQILVTAKNVCTAWREICRDPAMWCFIDMKLQDVDDIEEFRFDRFWLYRHAVYYGQGNVREVNIEGLGADEYEFFPQDNILLYIAQRCGNLRCLGITYNGMLSYHNAYIEALKKALMGFPLLEELHLHFICGPVKMGDIEAISHSCPMLKTFSLNTGYERSDGIERGNLEVLAIATFMPELRHLQLINNGMTNEGLENILNGCPKLESLDLRDCNNLDHEAELEKRCAQQIKILRLPHSCIHDFAWDVYSRYTCHEPYYSDWSDDWTVDLPEVLSDDGSDGGSDGWSDGWYDNYYGHYYDHD